MLDVTKKIADMFKSIAPVELAGSEKELTLPSIYLQLISNSAAVTMEHKDFLTRFTYQVDIYAETPKKCCDIAAETDSIMQLNGWQRSNGDLIGRQRYTATYKAIISEKYDTYKE